MKTTQELQQEITELEIARINDKLDYIIKLLELRG